MKITMFGGTDVGCVRKMNQDSIAYDEALGFGVVADGIGGRPGGEIASKIVTSTISNNIKSSDKIRHDSLTSFIMAQLDEANHKVLSYGRSHANYAGLGSTVNFLYFSGTDLHIAHVGDSRTYLFYKEHMFQLTVDHNLGTFIKRGLIDPNSISGTIKPAALMRAMGLKDHLESDFLSKKVKNGEMYLTASDGLFDMVADTTIRRILSEGQHDPSHLPQRLITEANKNGGVDNITVLISKVAA